MLYLLIQSFTKDMSAKNLVIVESPGKINKIQGFLGSKFKGCGIIWSH